MCVFRKVGWCGGEHKGDPPAKRRHLAKRVSVGVHRPPVNLGAPAKRAWQGSLAIVGCRVLGGVSRRGPKAGSAPRALGWRALGWPRATRKPVLPPFPERGRSALVAASRHAGGLRGSPPALISL